MSESERGVLRKTETVRVLVFKQGQSTYIAQCLEYDIAVQGRSVREVQENFGFCYLGHIALAAQAGLDRLDIPKAPLCYWDQFHDDNRLNGIDIPDSDPSGACARSARAEFALA